MKTVNDYLDAAKAITGSDYKTAKKIDVSRSVLSTIRTRETMSNKNAAKIATLLDVDLAEVIAACEIGKHPDQQLFWSKWVAVITLVTVGLFSQNPLLTNTCNNNCVYRAIYYTHIGYVLVCALVRALITLAVKIGSKSIEWNYQTRTS